MWRRFSLFSSVSEVMCECLLWLLWYVALYHKNKWIIIRSVLWHIIVNVLCHMYGMSMQLICWKCTERYCLKDSLDKIPLIWWTNDTLLVLLSYKYTYLFSATLLHRLKWKPWIHRISRSSLQRYKDFCEQKWKEVRNTCIHILFQGNEIVIIIENERAISYVKFCVCECVSMYLFVIPYW